MFYDVAYGSQADFPQAIRLVAHASKVDIPLDVAERRLCAIIRQMGLVQASAIVAGCG
jgi:hypothetical protein